MNHSTLYIVFATLRKKSHVSVRLNFSLVYGYHKYVENTILQLSNNDNKPLFP